MSEVSKSQVLLTVFSYVLSWFMGRRPEYTDPKVVAQGEGREGKTDAPNRNLRVEMGPQLPRSPEKRL